MVNFDNFVSTASDIGQRGNMEDRHGAFLCQHPQHGTFWVLFVADGHAGSETASMATLEFLPQFRRALDRNKGDFEQALRDSFSTISTLTRSNYPGSTFSCVVISENQERAYMAVLGDSPVIGLCGNDVIYMSPEHNAKSNWRERRAAIRRGATYDDGCIFNGHRGVQVTRAFGDSFMGDILNREPEISVIELDTENASDAFILATDGIWDPGKEHHDQAFEMLRGLYIEGKRAKDFVREALEYSGDNITVVTWIRNP